MGTVEGAEMKCYNTKCRHYYVNGCEFRKPIFEVDVGGMVFCGSCELDIRKLNKSHETDKTVGPR